MKIVVCVKHAASIGDEVAFTADGRAVDPAFLDGALGEWDACAAEEAIRLREAHGGEVVIVTAGDVEADASVRRCLAMGGDRGIRAWSDGLTDTDPIAVGRVLADTVAAEVPDLVLCGVQSSDAGSGAVGPSIAAFLGLCCETCVVALELLPGARLRVRRELEGGLIELREVDLPAVVTVQTGINEPRYATFRAIKQADQKELAVREARVPEVHAWVAHLGLPARDHHAEMLTGSPAEVAREIAAVVRERLP